MIKGNQKKQRIGIVTRRDILENQANICFLAIGSNLGNKINNINNAKKLLNKISVKILACSSIYVTPAWPNPKHPTFNNVVIKITTKLKLNVLFKEIKKIERILGRVNKIKNSPRTCDIDIIDFNGKIINTCVENENLILPHPRMKNRNFVLFPLYEIEKNWKYPLNNKNIIDLMCNLSPKSLTTIKLI